ncbi:MAG: hypothetical protein J0I47_08905 [Sphingomonas sp.]|uniref:hypothetical protein n=1 Tax=Sphingomonas sp. TaxID=28214 RepID=UPI001AD26B54|nr:hypothetical protein [Sphingomonas sp.]MBN8808337.1 hypothetical protein [Sphingomonas sp.]
MVVVSRFRWFGWFVVCVGVILGCYLMSSRVAAERNHLKAVEREIARTQRDIRALETEFDTRANLAQLQRWNGETLKLSAPTATQYARNDAQLAMLVDGPAPAMPQTGGMQTAAAVIPSAPTPPAVIETIPASVGPTTLPVKATPAKAIDKPAKLQTASLKTAAPKPSAKPRTQVALLDRRVGGSSLGDLMRRVRADETR